MDPIQCPPPSHSVRRLNGLAKWLDAKRYLEIGVETGVTFHQVACSLKTAVDPCFQFNLETAEEDNQYGSCSYHQVCSDSFFQCLNRQVDLFDLFFIDGLHHYDQVMRDFSNSLLHSHSRSVFLIDDVLPCDAFSAMRDQQMALELRARHSLGGGGNAWHGDVYLFIILLPLYFPSCRFMTLIEPGANPQALIWFHAGSSDVDEWTQSRLLWAAQNLAACDYTWLLENIDLLNPIAENDGMRLLFDSLS